MKKNLNVQIKTKKKRETKKIRELQHFESLNVKL